MASLADSTEVTQPPELPWPTLPSGQAMPAMSLSMSAIFLGMHVIQGVLGNFQLPGFIETLSKDRPNGQGDRLFTLPPNVINVDNFKRFTPRKRHLKPKKLFRRLGTNFDPFWMSADLPDDFLETQVKQKLDTSLLEHVDGLNLTNLEHTILTKYSDENGNGDTGSVNGSGIASGVLDLVKSWLLQKASCPVYYRWEDLGLLYWPRWVRRGMCSLQDTPIFKLTSESASKIPKFPPCSWPPGMHCVPAKPKRLKILRWQCRNNKAMNNFNRFRLPGMNKLRSLPTSHRHGDKKSESRNNSEHFRNHFGEKKSISTHKHIIQNNEERRSKRDTVVSEAGKDAARLYSSHQSDTGRQDSRKSDASSLNLGRMQSEVSSTRQGSTDHNKQDESDGNDTENWKKATWKQRQKVLDLTCKWIKIPYPVTDECFCSC